MDTYTAWQMDSVIREKLMWQTFIQMLTTKMEVDEASFEKEQNARIEEEKAILKAATYSAAMNVLTKKNHVEK